MGIADQTSVERVEAKQLSNSSERPASQRNGRPPRLGRPPAASKQFFMTYLGAFVVLHLLALLAVFPWLFSWTGVALVFVGNLVFGMLGINLAYHRLLTHQGLTLPKWLEHLFAILGVCCLQDAPARWVAIHRVLAQREPDFAMLEFRAAADVASNAK